MSSNHCSTSESRSGHPRVAALLLILSLALVAACAQETGPKKYAVRGAVTVDGKPLEDGYVMFEPEDRAVASAAGPIKNGTFSFESLPGPKKVQISASRPTSKMQEEVNPGAGKIPVYEQYLPAKYSSEKTELKAEVKTEGENKFDFELKLK